MPPPPPRAAAGLRRAGSGSEMLQAAAAWLLGASGWAATSPCGGDPVAGPAGNADTAADRPASPPRGGGEGSTGPWAPTLLMARNSRARPLVLPGRLVDAEGAEDDFVSKRSRGCARWRSIAAAGSCSSDGSPKPSNPLEPSALMGGALPPLPERVRPIILAALPREAPLSRDTSAPQSRAAAAAADAAAASKLRTRSVESAWIGIATSGPAWPSRFALLLRGGRTAGARLGSSPAWREWLHNSSLCGSPRLSKTSPIDFACTGAPTPGTLILHPVTEKLIAPSARCTCGRWVVVGARNDGTGAG